MTSSFLYSRAEAKDMTEKVSELRRELAAMSLDDCRTLIAYQMALPWTRRGRMLAWLTGGAIITYLVFLGLPTLAWAFLFALPFYMIAQGKIARAFVHASSQRVLAECNSSEKLREAVVFFSYFGVPKLNQLQAAMDAMPAEVNCQTVGKHLPLCEHRAIM